MDELLKLKNMLEVLLEDANENLGSEKVQPYICILEGLLKGINIDLDSDEENGKRFY